MGKMTQIKKGALISYITVAFNIIAGFFFTPYLINRVGSSSYGLYTLVSTFQNYFLIDFGLGNSVAKFLSEYRAKGEKKNAADFMAVVTKLFALLAGIIGLVLFILYFFLDNFFTGLTYDELLIFKKMYIISGFSSVILFLLIPLDGILTSYEAFSELKGAELLRKVLMICLSVVGLSFSNSPVLIIIANAGAGFCVTGIKYYFVKKKTDLTINWQYFNKEMIKKIGTFSLWLTLIMVAQRLIIPIAPTILGRYSTSGEISNFSIATTIEGYIYTIAACLNGLFLPKLTQMTLYGRKKEINEMFVKVGKIQVCIVGMIISALVVYGRAFITFWVGEDFAKAYWVLLLIIPSAIVVYAQEVANSVLMILNRLKYKAICYLRGSAVSVTISCILSPSMGCIGAGIGIAVCLWGFQVIAMNIIYLKVTDLNIGLFFRRCYLKYMPWLIGYVGLCVWINHRLPDSLVSLLVQMIIFVLIYCLLIWTLYLEKEEKNHIKNEIRNIRRERA